MSSSEQTNSLPQASETQERIGLSELLIFLWDLINHSKEENQNYSNQDQYESLRKNDRLQHSDPEFPRQNAGVDENQGVMREDQGCYYIFKEVLLNIMQICSVGLFIYGCMNIHSWRAIGIIGVYGYIIFVAIALSCVTTAKQARSVSHVSTETYINQYRQKNPIIETIMRCYRIEQLDGKRTILYTWRGTHTFDYDYVVDQSPEFRIINSGIIKLYIDQNIEFGDDYTSSCYQSERTEFIQNNMHRDKQYLLKDVLLIPGVAKQMLFVGYLDAKPWWLNYSVYVFSVLCCVQFVYVLWLRSVSEQFRYRFHKKVYSRQIGPQQY